MKSTFRAWLASSEVISQVLFTSEQPKKNKMAFVGISFVTNKVTLWTASYSDCVVYTKTNIHLSVGESGGYLPPLRWVINNYSLKWRWLAVDIYRAAKRRGKYLMLATDTEVNSCFSIY